MIVIPYLTLTSVSLFVLNAMLKNTLKSKGNGGQMEINEHEKRIVDGSRLDYEDWIQFNKNKTWDDYMVYLKNRNKPYTKDQELSVPQVDGIIKIHSITLYDVIALIDKDIKKLNDDIVKCVDGLERAYLSGFVKKLRALRSKIKMGMS